MPRERVGIRALRISLLLSSALVLVFCAVFYALERRQAEASIGEEADRLYEAHSLGLVEALWNYDENLLRAIAEGFLSYPYINYVSVTDEAGRGIESGVRKEGSAARSFRLVKRLRDGRSMPLGELTLEINSGRIASELRKRMLPSLALVLVSLALESLLGALLFARIATRHLTRIARHIEGFEISREGPPLRLERRPRGDEFDLLVDSFNTMSANLRASREAELDAMESLVRSLKEKDVLLQEIYHRTRNNMQLIAAILSMEAGPEPDGKLGGLVSGMNRRIAAISLVHKKLYESKDLSRIDLGEYFSDLVRAMESSLLWNRPWISISAKAEAGIVALIDAAVPCGLAVDELVANSIDHAFPGGTAGTILVELARGRPGELVIAVSDDGAGLPEGFDIARDAGTGLRIVSLLVESQLRGKLEYSSGHGARFDLRVREDLFEARV